MKKILCSLIAFICIYVSSYAQSNKTKGYLVPVGGGKIESEFLQSIVSLTKSKNPAVLIIPYASEEKNIAATVEKNIDMFAKIGITNITTLDVADPKAATLIDLCDMIWMPGGSQLKMRKALEKASLTDEILKRYKKGNVVISGTSAGASIMSDVMMASSNRDKTTGELHPVISYGLKLWPEVIIDQHFSQRKRLGRLKRAIEKYPNLLGIGIDESTCIIYNNDAKIAVLGAGTVTFVRKNNAEELKVTVLRTGETYPF